MPALKRQLTSYGWDIKRFCDDNLIMCSQLAEEAGISRGYLSEIMRGRYVGNEDIHRAIRKAMFRLRKA